MGKNKYAPKTAAKRKVEEEPEPTVKKPKGCPCPGMKGCTIGKPVSPGEPSVTLICSAVSCPFQGIPCHKQCFDKYEEQLLKTLGDKGSARGWTPYKARRNLWKNNGQGLIAMCCRCICEKGNVRPPEEVVLAERILVAPQREDGGERKKKGKKRDLPVINMNGGANVGQARMQARFEREDHEEEERRARDMTTPPYTPRRTRTNSVTSYSSQSIVSTASSQTRAPPSHERQPLRSQDARSARGAEKQSEESRARLDSGISLRTPPDTPVKELCFFAPPPPPAAAEAPVAAGKMSYAAAATSEERAAAAAVAITTTPKRSLVSTEPRSLLLSSSSASSMSSAAESMTSSSAANWELLPDRWYTQWSVEWEISTRDLYPAEVLRSHERGAGDEVASSIPSWSPWTGETFPLGEFILCNLRLPSLPPPKK